MGALIVSLVRIVLYRVVYRYDFENTFLQISLKRLVLVAILIVSAMKE